MYGRQVLQSCLVANSKSECTTADVERLKCNTMTYTLNQYKSDNYKFKENDLNTQYTLRQTITAADFGFSWCSEGRAEWAKALLKDQEIHLRDHLGRYMMGWEKFF